MKLADLPMGFRQFPFATEVMEVMFNDNLHDLFKDFPPYIIFSYDRKEKTILEDTAKFAESKSALSILYGELFMDLDDDEDIRVLDTQTGAVFIATLNIDLTAENL